jgi:hypothetical protein
MEGRGLWGVVRISHYLESAALIAFAISLHLLCADARRNSDYTTDCESQKRRDR